MALFSRGDSTDALVKKLENRGYSGPAEKRQILDDLIDAGDVKPDVLLRWVTGNDPDLARIAGDFYARGDDPRALDRLLTALPKLPATRWRQVVAAVQRLESPHLPERLGQLIRGKNTTHRLAALEILNGLPRWTEQLHVVKAALKDPEEKVRAKSVQILKRGLDVPAVYELLRAQLHNEDDAVRHGAIRALAEKPDPDLIEDFFDRLPDEPSRLQEVMIRGLAKMLRQGGSTGERVLERMLPLLAAEDELIRGAAAKLLASMPDKLHVLRRFMQYAKGLAFWLRDRSFGAIANVAEDLSDALLELMKDEDLDVVVCSTVMACKSGDPRVVPGLEGVLKGRFDWWVKLPLVESLGEFQHPDITRILVDCLDAEDLCTAALMTLGARGESATLPKILEFLDHPRRGRRRTALDALARFGDPRAIPQLERVARTDADEECRLVALEVLDEMGAEGVAAAEAIRGERRAAPESEEPIELSMVNGELDE